MRPKLVCALSGGVDSSVAAALLLERGFDVIGLFMRSGASGQATGEKQGCCSVEDALDARRTADALGIPFYALNMEAEFGRVIDHFVESYAKGLTPNPCIVCNRTLKFGHVLDFARKVGAERVATGHYARIVEEGGRLAVARPRDRKKDQTYVLANLTQDQLARSELPLGDLEKPDVRAIARRLGLERVADKAESQEICFVPGDYRELVRRRLPPTAAAAQAGEIRDVRGNVVGRHDGTLGATIGQRKGLGVALGRRAYVVDVDPESRAIVVGDKKDAERKEIAVRDVEWQGHAPLAPGETVRGHAQVRAHHQAVPAVARKTARGLHVTLDAPEAGVAPGQLLALYDERNDRVLAAGWIERGAEAAP